MENEMKKLEKGKSLFLPEKTVWAWNPDHPAKAAGFSLFKRIVKCRSNAEYRIAVSADNRYTLYLDGKVLGRGPARGSMDHYCYEEYAGSLSPGTHVFSVEVIVWSCAWRESPAPWGEIHCGGGFLCAGYAGDERMELPSGWHTVPDPGRRPMSWPESWDRPLLNAVPPMDEVDFRHHDSFWNCSEDVSGWKTPFVIGPAEFRGEYIADPRTPWLLEPRRIRQMEECFFPVAEILDTARSGAKLENGIMKLKNCPKGKRRILLDLGKYCTYMVDCSGTGGNGTCRIAYAESFMDGNGERFKRPAGEIGRQWLGDRLILPGEGKQWNYRSFWYRSGQFVELELDLQSSVKELEFRINFITYPFGGCRKFSAPGDPALEKIYEASLHTLKCCTHETFEDCPYYEQLQYAGDSRIHALSAYAATGDDTMARQMLRALDHSRTPDGLTKSRYPSVFPQVIPCYSLIWILSIHDHFMQFSDTDFLRELFPGAETVLSAFERHRRPDGLLDSPEGWHFTDWTTDWWKGCSDRKTGKPETILNLFYAEACRCVSEFCSALGISGAKWKTRRNLTIEAVRRNCFDPGRNRYSDVPGKKWYSLHANVLAVLYGAVAPGRRKLFLKEILSDTSLTQPTLYFSFYVLSAIRKYGTGVMFRNSLKPWEEMVSEGYSTFPEKPGKFFRSECHAWSAAPLWFLCGERKFEREKQKDTRS